MNTQPMAKVHPWRGSQIVGAITVAIALVLAVALQALASPVPAPGSAPPSAADARRCTGFEDLTLGTVYKVGDTFSSNGLSVAVTDFTFADGTKTSDGFVEVEQNAPPLAGGTGQELEVNNATVSTTFPSQVNGLILRFGEYGGNVNLTVNGDFRNTANFADLDGLVVGGAQVSVVNGFGNDRGSLRLNGGVTSFAVGGQELWIDDLCVFTGPIDQPEPEDPIEGFPDLGDAPDSTNHHANLANTAYSGPILPIAGKFPTVWEDPNGPPYGPRHRNATPESILGNWLSREVEADRDFDADGLNNILDGGVDNADNDHSDDGWRNRDVPFVDCQRTMLRVRVSKPVAGAQLDQMFLNVWFDGTRDGDWDDAGECVFPEDEQTRPSHEWIVQNHVVNTGVIPAGGFVDIPVNTKLIHNPTGQLTHWMRFTLSERPAVTPTQGPPDGRGPVLDSGDPGEFEFGETEDTLQRPAHDQPDGKPGLLELEKHVRSEAGPLKPGDVFSYTIRIRHVGGTAPATTVISDDLPSGLALAGPIQVIEEAPGAGPLAVGVSGKRVGWRGALAPDSSMRIEIPVRATRCVGGLVQLRNVVRARQTDGSAIEDDAVVEIDCPQLDPSDIVITQELVLDSPDGLDDTVSASSMAIDKSSPLLLFAGQRARWKVTAEWKVEEGESFAGPVVLGFSLNYEKIEVTGQDSSASAMEPARCVNGVARSGSVAAGWIAYDCWPKQLRLQPGGIVTAFFDVWPEISLDGGESMNAANDEEFPADDPEWESHLTYCLLGEGENACAPGAKFEHTNRYRLRIVRSDLGDAPDSTSHFSATTMIAYSGTTTVAEYPTVFDPATGAAQGPRHVRSRPFHLGRLVSWEFEADVGPDQDLINNIEPALGRANLDRHDDGVNPPVWTLTNCGDTKVPVQVYISPAAVNYFQQREDKNGYLNLWLDSNRDGSWDDAFECTDVDGQVKPAVEHVVIDYAVDVTALGPGLHVIQVPTGLVPWPDDQKDEPAWVRVTLSEQKSNKTLTAGAISYGDGRGYDKPFRTGETEDYLWRPGENPGGVDVAIRKRGRIRQQFNEETNTVNSTIAWTLEYGNRGDLPATNVVIRDTLEDGQNIIGVLVSLTKLPDVPHRPEGTSLVFDVGTLGPGERGRIIIVTQVTQAIAELTRVTNQATIRADGDVDPTNNTARAAVAVGVRPPRILDPGNGTTCETEVTIRGRAEANAEVEVYVDGASEGTTSADAQGRWSYVVPLADGDHTIYAVATVGSVTSPPSASVDITVKSTLPWSPLSLTFANANGRTRTPVDEYGRTDENGWSILLWPNTRVSVSVKLCCTNRNADVFLTIEGIDPVQLIDPDGDQIYEGSFESGPRSDMPVSMTLTVVCDGTEAVGSGNVVLIDPEGQVYDILTQALLQGAEVACMEQQAGAAGSGAADFVLWDASAFGQTNPQVTAADGYFSFLTPPGTYQLSVNEEGYQSYRSPDLQVVADPVRYDVGLTPVVDAAVDHRIEIGEFGFDPVVLTVKPGDVVEWVNVEVADHSATSFKVMAAEPALGNVLWDSGLLGAGESYKFRLTAEGTYSYTDRQNGANTGTIVVAAAEQPSDESVLYLPSIQQGE